VRGCTGYCLRELGHQLLAQARVRFQSKLAVLAVLVDERGRTVYLRGLASESYPSRHRPPATDRPHGDVPRLDLQPGAQYHSTGRKPKWRPGHKTVARRGLTLAANLFRMEERCDSCTFDWVDNCAIHHCARV
jgi:hypothetical protein